MSLMFFKQDEVHKQVATHPEMQVRVAQGIEPVGSEYGVAYARRVDRLNHDMLVAFGPAKSINNATFLKNIYKDSLENPLDEDMMNGSELMNDLLQHADQSLFANFIQGHVKIMVQPRSTRQTRGSTRRQGAVRQHRVIGWGDEGIDVDGCLQSGDRFFFLSPYSVCL